MNELTCADVTDLAGLYVLDALEPEERARVDAHLATCPEAHEEFAAVGGVAPALASLADPVGAPASLKNKVMADYRAGAGAAVWQPAPVAAPRAALGRPSWLGWAAAAVAVVLLAVAASWGYSAQSRAQMLSQAVDLFSAPGSSVAMLQGTGPAAGAHGFVAFDSTGAGYLVLSDLPSAPAGDTYQAWYIYSASHGGPSSAGLLSVDNRGFAVLPLSARLAGVFDEVALTVEPAGGSEQPTSQPVIVGALTPNA